MTEPTHHFRADVAAQLDIVLSRILVQVGLDDLERGREQLREALSDAWHHGWMTGFDDSTEGRRPSPNPYHGTDITDEVCRRRPRTRPEK